jgi:prepilin-type N-terminal cleavage/methylation domain-containing protein
MKTRSAFTLMELMVVIAVIAILSAIAVPIADHWISRHRFTGSAMEILQTLRLARLTAIQENKVVMFSVNAATGSYKAWVDDGGGDTTDLDLNGIPDKAQNGVDDPGERTIGSGTLPNGVRITAASFGGNPFVRFDNMGFPTDASKVLTGGSITIAGKPGESRQITLLMSGHSL